MPEVKVPSSNGLRRVLQATERGALRVEVECWCVRLEPCLCDTGRDLSQSPQLWAKATVLNEWKRPGFPVPDFVLSKGLCVFIADD